MENKKRYGIILKFIQTTKVKVRINQQLKKTKKKWGDWDGNKKDSCLKISQAQMDYSKILSDFWKRTSANASQLCPKKEKGKKSRCNTSKLLLRASMFLISKPGKDTTTKETHSVKTHSKSSVKYL